MHRAIRRHWRRLPDVHPVEAMRRLVAAVGGVEQGLDAYFDRMRAMLDAPGEITVTVTNDPDGTYGGGT